MSLVICLLVVTSFQVNFALADPIVQLPNGQIRGREATTFENKTFYAFQKIPYAAAPVGNLRFQPPQPAPQWDDILDATTIDVTCFQTGSNSQRESEDCLFINVYTPELPADNSELSLPVMLYIHGGGFVDGSSDEFAPDLFVNNDVILATINYRVGIFGFFSTQDEVVPGNSGLKDQQLAIQWTHDNIHLFGGNPDKITIFGESAGGASVAYQLLNQNNEGLFQGAILQSGSALSPWAYQRRARDIAFAAAAIANSSFETNNDSKALLDYFLDLPVLHLDLVAAKYYDFEHGPEDLEISQGFYWAPVVEVKNGDAFLTKKMFGLLQAGNFVQVPIMIGIMSEENLGFNSNETVLRDKLEAYDENLDWVVPNDMLITKNSDKVEMGKSIRELYTGGEPWADHLGDGVRYSSDTSFTRSMIKHAEIASKFVDTYFYVLSYDGEMPNGHTHYDGAESVGHGEDVAYLFCSGDGCDDSKYPESDRLTRQRMIKLWTNFAKYQNPTPDSDDITWPKVSTDDGDFFYLDIDEDLSIKNHPKEETYQGWNQLYESLGYDDFDTY